MFAILPMIKVCSDLGTLSKLIGMAPAPGINARSEPPGVAEIVKSTEFNIELI